ncbi:MULTISPECIES: hypothetical protein [unclassified Deinococcus]|uniref:hypothetical protein n=1 Tax=unclassified Deinococcus TaxID=2623546 RepID=UPI001C2F5306|nr:MULTISPECIES: hypothetical protein [unclassified Deinococcus]MDK2014472.1 hypothetical protein [Deinococcus sp. 43]
MPEQSTTRRPYEEFSDLREMPTEAHWTGEGDVPTIGQRVFVDGYGPGTVSAYIVWSHELHARVELDTRPDVVALPVMTNQHGAYLYATAHDLTPEARPQRIAA